MKRIGITGGIGSGKSVVSHLLRVMGYSVYDTDIEARRLTDSSVEIRRAIASTFGDDLYAGGELNRPLLAQRVFGFPEQIARLNAIVHPAVRADFERWSRERHEACCFVESAILYESGFDRLVDSVWAVSAPEALRIARVKQRSGLSESEVQRRIEAQMSDDELRLRTPRVIVNDGVTSIIGRVLSLLKSEI